MYYVVTMYRWGNRGNHSYVLGLFKSATEANFAGRQEVVDRSGKYEFEAIGFDSSCREIDRLASEDISECTKQAFIDKKILGIAKKALSEIELLQGDELERAWDIASKALNEIEV